MNLNEFALFCKQTFDQWVEIAKGIQPFADYPFINLWNLFLSSFIVTFVIIFIPGMTRKEAEEALNDYDKYEGDDGDMERYVDEDDFDW